MMVRLTYETTSRSRVSRSARTLLTELHEAQHWSGTPLAHRQVSFKMMDGFAKMGQHAMLRGTASGAAFSRLEDGRSTNLVHATVTIGPITLNQDLSEGGEASDLCPKSHLDGEWPAPLVLLKALKSQQQTKWRTLTVRPTSLLRLAPTLALAAYASRRKIRGA